MTNKNFHIVLAVIVIYLSLLSCSDLKIGVGLKGAIVDDEKMTLDGDTFDIRERIGDRLFANFGAHSAKALAQPFSPTM